MFFKRFPRVYYPFPTQDKRDVFIRVVTDITKNLRVYKKYLNDIVLFDEYDILDGDTPEIISEKLYGTPYYHWLIMISNDLYDHINDFPLSDYELSEYVTNKYSDAMGYHHFELNGIETQPYAEINFITAIKETGTIDINLLNKIGDSLNSSAQKEVYMIASFGYTVDTNFFSADENINDTSNVLMTTESTPFIRITSINYNLDSITPYIKAGVQLLSGDFSKEFYYTVYSRDNESSPLITLLSFVIKEDSFIIPDIYNVVTNYDYEVKKNESKRRIKVLAPTFIPLIKREFEEIMRNS